MGAEVSRDRFCSLEALNATPVAELVRTSDSPLLCPVPSPVALLGVGDGRWEGAGRVDHGLALQGDESASPQGDLLGADFPWTPRTPKPEGCS